MATTGTLQTAPAGTWGLDPVHSSIGFQVPDLVGTFKGSFRDVSAQLVADGSTARVEGTARVASVDVKDDNLNAHLQSPDFFDAERHPELRFEATGLDLDSEAVGIQGELTIKGVTRPVEVTGTYAAPIVDAFGNDRIGLVVSTTIDRTDFAITWTMQLPTGKQALGNDVTIVAELYFVKQA
jgi:polyisoprenoid-binding protein YceI